MIALTIIGLGLAVVGIATTWYVRHLQEQRGRVQVKVQIEEKPFNPRQERDVVYSNSKADKAVTVEICSRSRHRTPIQVQSSIIAVPKLLQSPGSGHTSGGHLDQAGQLLRSRYRFPVEGAVRSYPTLSRKHGRSVSGTILNFTN